MQMTQQTTMQRRKRTVSEIPSGADTNPRITTSTTPYRRKVKKCTMIGLVLLTMGTILLMITIYKSVDWTVRKLSPPMETSSKWTHQHSAAMDRSRQMKPLPQPWKNIRILRPQQQPLVVKNQFSSHTKCHPQQDDTNNNQQQQQAPRLNRDILDKSLALGTKFVLEHQKPFGNFEYEYDWTTGTTNKDDDDDDDEVRQASSLWGLSLIFHDMMDTFDSDDVDGMRVLHIMSVHLLRAFEFFVLQNSEILEFNGVTMRYIVYPGGEEDEEGTTKKKKHAIGTMGLVSLALIEFLRATDGDHVPEYVQLKLVSPHKREELESFLRQMLAFLVTSHSAYPIQSLEDRFRTWNKLVSGATRKSWQYQEDPYAVQTANGGGGGYFLQHYDKDGVSSGISSPDYDGECLLAVVKAAKYLNDYNFLYPMAVGMAKSLHHRHVRTTTTTSMAARNDEKDNKKDSSSSLTETNGFYYYYQWFSMAFYELATVEFLDEEDGDEYYYYYDPTRFGSWLVDLALWMVDVHPKKTLDQPNMGYAYEGIIPAWYYAATTTTTSSSINSNTAQHLHCTIEEGMARLISWQVGMGVVENNNNYNWDGTRGLGGVQNSLKEPGLRIDTTQHQMHATILARRLIYPEPNTWPWSTELFVSPRR